MRNYIGSKLTGIYPASRPTEINILTSLLARFIPIASMHIDYARMKGFNSAQARQQQKMNSLNSIQTSIYFSIHVRFLGSLKKNKIVNALDLLDVHSQTLKSNFSANFPHARITLLESEDLIRAVRTLFFGQPIEDDNDTEGCR